MTAKDIKKTARIAGVLYLIIAFLAPFGDMFARDGLVVPGDMAATAANIIAAEGLYRLGFVSDLVTQVVHTLLVLALYNLLKRVNSNHAWLMVMWGLVAVPISMLNEVIQFVPLLLLSGADYLTAFTADQLQALVPLFLDLREHGVMIVHLFWGLWLFPLGYLVFKSGFLPKVLGILLMIGCFGYLMDFTTFFLFPNFGVTVKQFTFIGELLLPLWLLIKGVDVEQWEKYASKSA